MPHRDNVLTSFWFFQEYRVLGAPRGFDKRGCGETVGDGMISDRLPERLAEDVGDDMISE